MACCEGHMKDCVGIYISFVDNYFVDTGVPEGFKYDKKRKIVSYYSKKLTKEKAEEIKTEKLNTLLEWCKSLPNKNNKNTEN